MILRVFLLSFIVLAAIACNRMQPPNDYSSEIRKREAVVIERLKDIRSAQIAYRSRFGKFTGDFDSLMCFIKNDSIKGSTSWVNIKDSLFKSSDYNIDSLPYIPFSDAVKFTIKSGFVKRGLVTLPVFEVSADAVFYLHNLNHNLNDLYDSGVFVGLKVGSMLEASLDGNWE